MKFVESSMEELVKMKAPTFNVCDHYIEPQGDKMETIVIKLENGKHLIVNINPESDNVDVKLFGDHVFKDFGTVKAFYNMRGLYGE